MRSKLFSLVHVVGDGGGDGDIATFYFRVPDNAQTGAVYPIEVYYRDGDLFTNSAANDSYQKYAFSHAVNGSVMIE